MIVAQHQLEEGLEEGEGLGHTIRALRSHIDAIHDVTRSYDHVGFGSDLDGFIEPVMPEIGRAEDLAKLGPPLRAHYEAAVADAILYGSAAELVARVLAQREP